MPPEKRSLSTRRRGVPDSIMTRLNRPTVLLFLLPVFLASSRAQIPAPTQPDVGLILDEAAAPGDNYEKAEFRLWLPPNSGPVRAVVVMVPGSNGDWRSQVTDPVWQQFATDQHLALVGCSIKDKPHDQGFIEEYVDVKRGSGQALLDTMTTLAQKANHPELARAPFLLWGMSAGGQFNYEFTAWKPERVAAFVVNKGGIYYTALTSKAARAVPGILFTGGKDLDSRVSTISGLFAVNRRGGALWALAEEPGVAHVVGKSRDVTLVFFDEVLARRLGPDGTLKAIDAKTGVIGDLKTKTIAATGARTSTESTAWFLSERVAQAWLHMVTAE
jgi:poly(3-hydroxybutyrate) depolymerase